jgi:hypothetical protein
MKKPNRFLLALQENANLIGLAGVASLTLATSSLPLLLAGVVAEAAYLLFVPDSKWYQNRLARRHDAEVRAQRERLKAQVFPAISEKMQEQFGRLERIREQLEGRPEYANEDWFRQILRKLDYLLEKFLLFARKDAEFRAYLNSVYLDVVRRGNPEEMNFDYSEEKGRKRQKPIAQRTVENTVNAIQERYAADIRNVQAQREDEADLNTQAILDKRKEVLEQRHEYVGKIGRILTNLGHQMELLEDSFGLINDQIRARSPEQVLADIEGVVTQTDAMTQLLEDFGIPT